MIAHPTGLMTAARYGVDQGKWAGSNLGAANVKIGSLGPAIWLDANIAGAAGGLANWPGRVESVAQATAGNQPTFAPQGLSARGRLQPTVETDGTDDFMDTAAVDLSGVGVASIYVSGEVVTPPASVGNAASYGAPTAPTANSAFVSGVNSALSLRDELYGGGTTSVTNYGTAPADPHITAHTFDRDAATAAESQAYIDGAVSAPTFTSHAAHSGNWTAGNFCIGALSGGTTYQLARRYREVILYPAHHSAATVFAVSRAMAYKARI